MEEIQTAFENSQYDQHNKETLLDGYQLTLLKKLIQAENSEVGAIDTIYYLFGKYWPSQLASIIREKNNSSLSDRELIQSAHPGQFLKLNNTNWKELNNTVNILEETRQKVLAEQKS